MIPQVMEWLTEEAPNTKGPVLEVGSMNINGSVRPLFPEPYVGLDYRNGAGVDVLGDVTTTGVWRAAATLDRMYEGLFNTVVATETLEHVSHPWRFMQNVADILRPGGLVFITVPWEFGYHPHPEDYWRMSPSALTLLFADAGLEPLWVDFKDTHTFGKARK